MSTVVEAIKEAQARGPSAQIASAHAIKRPTSEPHVSLAPDSLHIPQVAPKSAAFMPTPATRCYFLI